jgi:hypothetical protein
LLRFFHKRHQEQMMAELILVAVCLFAHWVISHHQDSRMISLQAVWPWSRSAKTQHTTHSWRRNNGQACAWQLGSKLNWLGSGCTNSAPEFKFSRTRI